MLSFKQTKTIVMKQFDTFYQTASVDVMDSNSSPNIIKKTSKFGSLLYLGPEGFEPTTKGLWVPCATAAP